MTTGGLNHQTVLSGGAYLRNWNLGARPADAEPGRGGAHGAVSRGSP